MRQKLKIIKDHGKELLWKYLDEFAPKVTPAAETVNLPASE